MVACAFDGCTGALPGQGHGVEPPMALYRQATQLSAPIVRALTVLGRVRVLLLQGRKPNQASWWDQPVAHLAMRHVDLTASTLEHAPDIVGCEMQSPSTFGIKNAKVMGFEFAQLGGEPKYLVKLPELSESGATMSPCFACCPRRALRNAHEIAFVELFASALETFFLGAKLKYGFVGGGAVRRCAMAWYRGLKMGPGYPRELGKDEARALVRALSPEDLAEAASQQGMLNWRIGSLHIGSNETLMDARLRSPEHRYERCHRISDIVTQFPDHWLLIERADVDRLDGFVARVTSTASGRAPTSTPAAPARSSSPMGRASSRTSAINLYILSSSTPNCRANASCECALAGQSSTLSARARGAGRAIRPLSRSIAPSLCAALLATRE